MGRSTTIKNDRELEICDRHRFGFTYTTPSSSELIGYVDLMASYEIWPNCSLVINAQKCVRLF